MVTKVITYLLADTLPVQVIKSAFLLLPLGRYLLPAFVCLSFNRYKNVCSFAATEHKHF